MAPKKNKKLSNSMDPKKNKKQSNNAAESSSKSTVAEKKTPQALKGKRKLIKKLSHINSAQTKEAEISSQMQAKNIHKKAKKSKKGNHVGEKDASKSENINEGNNEMDMSGRFGEMSKCEKTQKSLDINEGQDSAQTKEAEISSQMQAKNKRKEAKKSKKGNHVGEKEASKSENINEGNNEMDMSGRFGEMSKCEKTQKSLDINERQGEVNNDAKTLNSLGGVIFMCNARTKEDCFRYRVMGVSASRQDFVMGVKPGLKLFLFDFDLKLMYGIYEASAAGGMRLQPAAFGGAFPAQVPFRIHKDCIPLPENVFKQAIKENYDEKTRKFKTELTVLQVQKLTELFRPAPCLDPTLKPVLQDPVAQPVIQRSAAPPLSGYEPIREHLYGAQYGSSRAGQNFSPHDHGRQQFADHHVMCREVGHNPHFLTEKEYRSYGLQQAKYMQPSTSAVHAAHKLDHYGSEQGIQQLLRTPASVRSDAAFAGNQHVYSDAHFPNEREYRSYGLMSLHGQPGTVTPAAEISNAVSAAANHSLLTNVNPYDEDTTSLVNRYLSLPRTMITPGELPLTGRESFASASNYVSDIRGHPGRLPAENVRFFQPNTPYALSGYGHIIHQQPRDELGRSSSVLPQYPFGGPPASRR